MFKGIESAVFMFLITVTVQIQLYNEYNPSCVTNQTFIFKLNKIEKLFSKLYDSSAEIKSTLDFK